MESVRRKVLLILTLISLFCAVHVRAQCRVMADCGENVVWKEMWQGQRGYPGKRGAPGPKGDEGLGVNMTEFLLEFEKSRQKKKGPSLHFYTQTVTWNSGKAFCQSLGKKLCHSTELCFRDDEGGRNLIPDLMSGDHWVPVLDDGNQWLQAGDGYGRTCLLHTELGSRPPWGTSTTAAGHKGYVYCCEGVNAKPELGVKYRYIGKTANYQKSKDHCEQQGRRLCYASEVCSNNVPRFGVISGDHWVAVKDRENEWVEVGDNGGRTCWVHGVRYILPPWGVRISGELNHVGYVLCCPI